MPIKWSLDGAVKAMVLAAVIAGLILIVPNFLSGVAVAWVEKTFIEPQKTEEKAEQTPITLPHSEQEKPTPIKLPDFLSLLEKSRHGSAIRAAVKSLGHSEIRQHRDGVEICCKDLGIHLVFDRIDNLDKVIFYGDTPDPHETFRRSLPLPINLSFNQTREEAGIEIDNHAGRHIDAELGRGEWDKYEMQGYRLYLRFSRCNGKELIREIQLVRPKNELAAR